METRIAQKEKPKIPDWLLKRVDHDELLATILLQRGIDTPEGVEEFLDPDQYKPTDPGDFPQMNETVALILQIIAQEKKICVYGDYDVDGVTSTTILVQTLDRLQANLCYHLPDRFTEGYGLNQQVIRELAGDVDLIVTCDCGISNHSEIELAQKLGMQVIVTDHHHLPEKLPPADLILSPKLLAADHKAHHLPGAGMAFFLAAALLCEVGRDEEVAEFLDLLSLAIVADVVPLVGENRYLLQRGLPQLARTKRPGLLELFQVSGIDPQLLTEEDIGFRIAPRINAAGRLKSAELAVQLLLAQDSGEARSLARQIDQINTKRKDLGQEMYDEARQLLGRDFAGQPIVLYQPHWHQGILGITASRLCEEYHVPVLLMGLKGDQRTITGSARSINGIHIYEALKKSALFLDKFGGHAGAAGFSLSHEKLTGFEKTIEGILTEELALEGQIKEIVVDAKLPLAKVDKQQYFALRRLAPFGESNPEPRFLANNVQVVYHRATGDQKHLRLILKDDAGQLPAIWWGGGETEVARKVDLVYHIGLNTWQGREEIQLVVNHLENKSEFREGLPAFEEKLDFTIVDRRNWRELGEELNLAPEALYYHEGKKRPGGQNVVNRYQIQPTKTLVLLTMPPGIRVLEEILYTSRPQKVVLAYSQGEIGSGKEFFKRLISLVKFVIQQRSGKVNLYQLAAATAEMEITVLMGLRYLEEKGDIELDFVTPDQVMISIGKRKESGRQGLTVKKMQTLLKESRAFRSYLLRSELEKIKKIILSRR